MPSYEKIPFLDHDGKREQQEAQWQMNVELGPTRGQRWSSMHIWLAVSLLLNVVCSTALIALLLRHDFVDPHHFAKESIVYKDVPFHEKSKSIYFQPPSNETDNAWTKLADEHVIRIQEEEVAGLGEHPIWLPESTGYASAMGVGHEIHCLGWLRRFVYSDHYYPNITRDRNLRFQEHADHCLNELLQSAMCAADTSIMVYHWHEEDEFPYYAHHTTARTCVDWDLLTAAMKPRVVSQPELQRLKSPFEDVRRE